jgi:Fur family transcriptional regulator, ferric uptake regulator
MAERRKPATVFPCGRPIPQNPSLSPISEDEELAKWRLRLKTFLSGKGLKYSEQRWNIVKLILSEKGHFNTQEIAKKVNQAYPGIGTATVYRNLKLLCEAMILKESLMDVQGRVVYERFEEGHHDHIVCLDCGQIFEFHDDDIESQQERICRKQRFEEVSHRHVIYARCAYQKRT